MKRPNPARAAALMILLAGSLPAFAHANFAGVWKLVATDPAVSAQTREASLALTQEGAKVTGTITVDGMEIPIQDAAIQENELRFKAVGRRDGELVTAIIKVTLNGDILQGSAEGPGPEPIRFTGTRQPAATLTGAWSLTIETPNQTYRPTVTLAHEGEKLTGTLRTEEGTEAKLVSGSVKGDEIAFVVDLNVGDQELHLEFSGKRSPTGLKGSLRLGEQNYPWSGARATMTATPAK